MANKKEYLGYTIYLTDPAVLAELQSLPHAGGQIGRIVMAPDEAAVLYAAPKLGRTDPVVYPSIQSDWFGTEAHFPTNVRTFERCSGGWFGICWLFGKRIDYYWIGTFALAPDATGGVPGGGTPAAISQRRWIDGFELVGNGLGAASSGNGDFARKSSRHTEGLGLAVGTSGTAQTHIVAEYAAGITPNKSWERFYIRAHAFPTAATTIWKACDAFEAQAGLALGLSATGQPTLSTASNTGVLSLLSAGTALVLERWYRIDVLVQFGAAANAKLYIDGVLAINIVTISGGGMATTGRTHGSSVMGGAFPGSLDVDDWMCADWPATLDGVDWLNGSHMALVQPTEFDTGGGVDWTGPGGWRTLLQHPPIGALMSLTTSIAGGRLGVHMDGAAIDASRGSLGICAAVASIYGSRVAGIQGMLSGAFQDGVLGYGTTGFTQTASLAWSSVMWRPSGLTEAQKMGITQVVHNKALGTVTAATAVTLCLVVEVLGRFGQCDIPVAAGSQAAAVALPLPVHNAPYPRTPWAHTGPPPQSPVVIVSGTYVGTGTFLELPFMAPVHWIWIRPTTLDVGGVRWWSAHLGAHQGLENGHHANGLVQALLDPTFAPGGEDTQQQQTILRIVGDHSQSNQLGETYHYVAFCDPGMRFLVNGALATHEGALDATTPLVHPTFLANALQLWIEVAGNNASMFYYKGPGAAAASITPVGGNADVASALTIAAGAFTHQAALHGLTSTAQQIAFAAFRRDDGSGDVGVPRVVSITSYVGDGAASRTIGLTPLSGRRPCFALVAPHNGPALMRDPSFTGTQSVNMGGSTNAATGITAGGIDQLTVGVALNANGIVYDVFVLPGSEEACQNGWSCDGVFIPVDPTPPVDGPWDPEPTDPDDPGVPVDPGPDPGDLPPDFEGQCLVASTKLVNRAISRLGESLQVVDLATELSPAAVQARLHYIEALEATLRDYPWPFATRYAALTLVAGTATVPVNRDWQYSYRAPTNMLFARRFVKVGVSRAYDPVPAPFRVGSDTIGPLLYSNLAAVDVQLEYTIRVSCAASQGDPLFRSAFTWRLAHEMGPAIARDERKVGFAWAMYERQIATARVAAANEAQPDQQSPDAPWITERD
jgi:hypothetical protein